MWLKRNSSDLAAELNGGTPPRWWPVRRSRPRSARAGSAAAVVAHRGPGPAGTPPQDRSICTRPSTRPGPIVPRGMAWSAVVGSVDSPADPPCWLRRRLGAAVSPALRPGAPSRRNSARPTRGSTQPRLDLTEARPGRALGLPPSGVADAGKCDDRGPVRPHLRTARPSYPGYDPTAAQPPAGARSWVPAPGHAGQPHLTAPAAE